MTKDIFNKKISIVMEFVDKYLRDEITAIDYVKFYNEM